ncbi:MAG: hypothetical protein QOF48_4027 [Verrucomicrobiota bacterium]|jgi:lysophospholipase L1-like esterase
MKRLILLALGALLINSFVVAQELESIPDDPYLAKFKPRLAPRPTRLLLQKGDRLAICGDSITEQKMYSRYMETYLTVCTPELEVAVRQYGWGGEVAPGFLGRMTNDCLRFKPTIATTCYGMNDHGYGAYKQAIGDRYRNATIAIVSAFKKAGARVVVGSPGCVSHNAPALNLNLCELRNIDIDIAQQQDVNFADVFWPMLTAEREAHKRYATNYWIAGNDGVHPGGAGHLVMAYAFLKGLGLDGDIGTVTIDLEGRKAQGSDGHKVASAADGAYEIKSTRYPFCATGDKTKDSSVRSGMTLVPFNQELNRLMLIGTHAGSGNYKVTWSRTLNPPTVKREPGGPGEPPPGPTPARSWTKTFSGEQLAKGVNLADEFETNPFTDAFAKVDAAVGAKQSYETHQIKDVLHGPEAKLEMAEMVALSERVRAPLIKAIHTAFVPVTHTIQIVAE